MNATQTETAAECAYCQNVKHSGPLQTLLASAHLKHMKGGGVRSTAAAEATDGSGRGGSAHGTSAVWPRSLSHLDFFLHSHSPALWVMSSEMSILTPSSPPHQHLRAEVSFPLCFCLCSKSCAASVETHQVSSFLPLPLQNDASHPSFFLSAPCLYWEAR